MTIVPIHGLGGSNAYWQPIHDYPELAAYSILIPDLVGYGDSQPAPKNFKYTMREQAEAIKALIDKSMLRVTYSSSRIAWAAQ